MKNAVKTWTISSELIIQEAEKQGFEIEVIVKERNLFYIKKGGKKILFKNIDCGLNSALGYKIAEDKELTYGILGKYNLPVPQNIYINEEDRDKEINIKFPLVVKPVDGAHGDGVSVNISNIERYKKALDISFSISNRAIVQNYIKGDDHRVIVIGGKVVAATKRIPAFIIGNGNNTIEELIKLENTNNKMRGYGHTKAMSFIKIDEELELYIQEQRLGLDSIPKKNEKIFVRRNANLSTGGMAYDVTDILHPQVIDTAIKAAHICKLEVTGIDILTSDISKSLDETNGVIIEINATPGLRMHYYPTEGISRTPAKDIVELVNK